jgi:hypothetical protein
MDIAVPFNTASLPLPSPKIAAGQKMPSQKERFPTADYKTYISWQSIRTTGVRQ